MASLGNILVVDDDPDILLSVRLLLKKSARSVQTEPDPTVLPALIREKDFDVVLLDMNFAHDVDSGNEGFTWLQRIHDIDPSLVVILITAFGDVDKAVRAIKAGATDFVLKPWQNEKLLATLAAATNLRQLRRETRHLRDRERIFRDDINRQFGEFVGTSAAMNSVFAALEKVAATDANVLILGENGTGKELAARELHRRSMRRDGPFITVDMAAIPETLFEAELFGHVRGAFTGAHDDRAGRFEGAAGGTLFLDEIGNLPMHLQSKLLAALQNKQVTRLGSNRPIPVDNRLICATNASLSEMISRREFREDLYYRIQTVELRLPPLRERTDDIPALVDHFFRMYCRKYHRPARTADGRMIKRLQSYSWPGNVRELQHAVERAVILNDPDILPITSPAWMTSPSQAPSDAPASLEMIERQAIERALRKHDGNITRTAKELGLTRAALYRRIEKHGV